MNYSTAPYFFGRLNEDRQNEIARNMLALGIEVPIIAKASGLSEAVVQSLNELRLPFRDAGGR